MAMVVTVVEIFEEAGDAGADGVAEAMDRVGGDGDGAGEETADEFCNREGKA